MKVKAFLLLIFISNLSYSYVLQRSESGDFLYSSFSQMSFYLDATEARYANSAELLSYASNAANEWRQTSAPSLSIHNGNGAIAGRNDLIFTSDDLFFPSNSVLAITQTIFNEDSGRIVEADIYIKPFTYAASTSVLKDYFESLFAHEFGHSIGIDHSQVHYSTMFYTLIRGQGSLHLDDQSAANDLYGVKNGHGFISGRVAGGDSVIGIFGAHIQAVSSLTGRVMAAAISDVGGSFKIENLPLDDTYYLYIEPFKLKSSLSNYYSDIRNNFCAGGYNYRGAFYQGCGNSRKGYPQGIKLNGNKDIGVISVRCGVDVPNNYLQTRDESEPLILGFDGVNAGEALVGYFSSEDIANNKFDEFVLDLSSYNVTSNNLYFEVKLTSQSLYSKAKWDMKIQSPGGTTYFSNGVDLDGNPNLDLVARVLLDINTPSNNVFTIRVTPTDFSAFDSSEFIYNKSDYFPSSSELLDEMAFYLLIMNVSQREGSIYSLFSHKDYENLVDNTQCMDASDTFTVNSSSAAISEASSSSKKLRDNSDALACGSVSINGSGPGSGSMFPNLLLGLLLSLLLSKSKSLIR